MSPNPIKLAFSSKAITQKVNGEDRSFYPISLRVAFNLQSVAKPLARALTTLLSPTKQDTGLVTEDYVDQGATVQKTTRTSISLELAELRSRQRADAVQGLVEELLNAKNIAILGELFLDALTPPRDRKSGEREPAECDAFMAQVDLGALIDLFQGVARANASVFGALGEKLARQANEVLARAMVRSEQDSSSTSTTAPETSGSSSKTP